jgi:hypothetical protein
MKQEVTRRVDLRLLPRARAVLSRAFAGLLHQRTEDGSYLLVGDPEPEPHALDYSTSPDRVRGSSRWAAPGAAAASSFSLATS